MVFGRGKPWVGSGFGFFFDAFSRAFFLGHLPSPPFFDPGPAYNPIGPAQIIPAAATPTITTTTPPTAAIISGQPIYTTVGCGSVECDIFAFDRNIKTPYMENYNLNVEERLASKVMLQLGC